MIYSVTVSVDNKRFEEWRAYMLTKHIPDVLATGCFFGHSVWRHVQSENSNYTTTNINYFVESKRAFDVYSERFAPALQQEHSELFADCFSAQRAILEPMSALVPDAEVI